MKQLFTHGYRLYLCLLACLLLSIGGVQGQTTLAAWTFDGLSASPNTPKSINSNFGINSASATLFANGSEGSSDWVVASSGTELNAFTGSVVNDPRTPASASQDFALVNSAANGKNIILKLPTSGYQNIVLRFATRGTATGFNNHQWAWSTNGTDFTNFGNNTVNNTATYEIRTLDLSAISSVNDQANIWLRLTVSGATNASGNNRFDNIVVEGTVVGGATLAANPTSLSAFGNVDNGSFSSVQEYTLTAGNLSADVVITAPANFQVSKTSTGGFASSITYTVAEFGASQTVFARFAPASGLNGTKSGNITNVSGTASTNVAVSGTETGTQELIESFEAACPSLGTWRQISVIGDGQTWQCSTNGRVGNAARMSGFAGGAQDNEDWLISPALNITAASRLSFFSRKNFMGPDLTLHVSTNYNGTGNPNDAT